MPFSFRASPMLRSGDGGIVTVAVVARVVVVEQIVVSGIAIRFGSVKAALQPDEFSPVENLAFNS